MTEPIDVTPVLRQRTAEAAVIGRAVAVGPEARSKRRSRRRAAFVLLAAAAITGAATFALLPRSAPIDGRSSSSVATIPTTATTRVAESPAVTPGLGLTMVERPDTRAKTPPVFERRVEPTTAAAEPAAPPHSPPETPPSAPAASGLAPTPVPNRPGSETPPDVASEVPLAGPPNPSQPQAALRKQSPPTEAVAIPAMRDERVNRSQITSGIVEREPVDQLGAVIDATANGPKTVFYFNELRNMSGRSLTHTWLHHGRSVSTMRFTVGSSRWRLNSRKTFSAVLAGDWQVVLQDESGKVLASERFEVR
jgi:hypothetical protein